MSARTCRLGDCRRPHLARGLCELHYWRQYRTGSTADPVQTAAELMHAANRARARARLEDYQWLRDLGMTREAARQRMGLSDRTIWRYEARLRTGAGTRQEAA